MSTERVIAGFLRVAMEDLQGARALAKIANRNAIYLCSQAAEKVIRAVLTSEGTHAGVGHQLDRMVDSVPDENPVKKMLRRIQGYLYLSRDPEERDDLCDREPERAAAMAGALRGVERLTGRPDPEPEKEVLEELRTQGYRL